MNIEAVPCILRNGDGTPVYGLLIRPVQSQLVIPVSSKGAVVAAAAAASTPLPVSLSVSSSPSLSSSAQSASASTSSASNSSYGAISTSAAANGTSTGCATVAMAVAADASHSCLPSTSLQLPVDVGVVAKTAVVTAATAASSSSLSSANGGGLTGHKTYPVILPRDSSISNSNCSSSNPLHGPGGTGRALNLNPLFIPATAVQNFHQSRFPAYGSGPGGGASGSSSNSVSNPSSNSNSNPNAANPTAVPGPAGAAAIHLPPVASSHAVVYSVTAAAAQPSSSCELVNAAAETTFDSIGGAGSGGDSRGMVAVSAAPPPESVVALGATAAVDDRQCKNFALQLSNGGDLNPVQQQNATASGGMYPSSNGTGIGNGNGNGGGDQSSSAVSGTNGMTELDHFLQDIDSNDLTTLLQEWTSENNVADAMFVDSSSFTSSHLDALDSMCSASASVGGSSTAKMSLAGTQTPPRQQHASGGECSTPGPAPPPSVASSAPNTQQSQQQQPQPSQQQSSPYPPFSFNFSARPPCRYQSFLSNSNLRINSSSIDVQPNCYRNGSSSNVVSSAASSFNPTGQLMDTKTNFVVSAAPKIPPPPPPQNTQVSCSSVVVMSDLESSKYTPISEPVTPTSSAADADAGPYEASTPDSGIQSIGESPQGPLSSPSQPLPLNSPHLVGGVGVGLGVGVAVGASIGGVGGQQSPSVTSCTPSIAGGVKYDDAYSLRTQSTRNPVNSVSMNMVAATGSSLNHVLTIDIDSANGTTAMVSAGSANRTSATAAVAGAAATELGDFSSAVNTPVLAISRCGDAITGYTTTVSPMTAAAVAAAASKANSKRRSADFDDMPFLVPETKVVNSTTTKKPKRRPSASPKPGSKISPTIGSSTGSVSNDTTFGRMTPTNDAFATLMEAKISEISQKFNSICDSIVSDRLPTDCDELPEAEPEGGPGPRAEMRTEPIEEATAIDGQAERGSDRKENHASKKNPESSNVVVLNTSADPGSLVDKILSYLRPEQLHSFSRLFEEKLKQLTLLNEYKSEVASPSNACTVSPQTDASQPSPSLWLDGVERERDRERKFSGYMSDESSISLRSDSGISEGPRSNESVPSRKCISAAVSGGKGPAATSRFRLSSTSTSAAGPSAVGEGDHAKRRGSDGGTMADTRVRERRMIQKLVDYRAKARRAMNSMTDFADILQLCRAFDHVLSISSETPTAKCGPFQIDMNSVVAKMKKASLRTDDETVTVPTEKNNSAVTTAYDLPPPCSRGPLANDDVGEKCPSPSSPLPAQSAQGVQPSLAVEKPFDVAEFTPQPSSLALEEKSYEGCGPSSPSSSFEHAIAEDKFCPFVEIKDSPETKNVSLKIRLGLLNSSHSSSSASACAPSSSSAMSSSSGCITEGSSGASSSQSSAKNGGAGQHRTAAADVPLRSAHPQTPSESASAASSSASSQSEQRNGDNTSRQRRKMSRSRAAAVVDSVTVSSRKRSKRTRSEPVTAPPETDGRARSQAQNGEFVTSRTSRHFSEENQRCSAKVRLRRNDDGGSSSQVEHFTGQETSLFSLNLKRRTKRGTVVSSSAVSSPATVEHCHTSKPRRKHLSVTSGCGTGDDGVWVKASTTIATKSGSCPNSDNTPPSKRARRHYKGNKGSWNRARHRKSASNRTDFRCCQHCHTWFYGGSDEGGGGSCERSAVMVGTDGAESSKTGGVLCSKCEYKSRGAFANRQQVSAGAHGPDRSTSDAGNKANAESEAGAGASTTADTSATNSAAGTGDKPCRLILRKMKHSMNSTKSTARFSIVKNSSRNDDNAATKKSSPMFDICFLPPKKYVKSGLSSKASCSELSVADAFSLKHCTALRNKGEFSNVDFFLPYDIWWQHSYQKNFVCVNPSTCYQRIRNNIYLDTKPTTSRLAQNCVCTVPTDSNIMGCREDCLNRLMFTECSADNCPCGDQCSNQRFQRHRWVQDLETFDSHSGKGIGVRVSKSVAAGTFVCEYVGEVVSTETFAERMKTWYKECSHHYALHLDAGTVIDSYRCGSIARFINHSCQPNCEMQKWWVSGQYRMGVFAIRDIQAGEELSYNYKFHAFKTPQRCLCGSDNCDGYIGDKQSNSGSSRHVKAPPKRVLTKQDNSDGNSWKLLLCKPLNHRERLIVAKRRIFLLRNIRRVRRKLQLSNDVSASGSPDSRTNSVEEEKRRAAIIFAKLTALKTCRSVRTRHLAESEENGALERLAELAQILKYIVTCLINAKDDSGELYCPTLQAVQFKRRGMVTGGGGAGGKIGRQTSNDFASIEKKVASGSYPTPDAFDHDVQACFAGERATLTDKSLQSDLDRLAKLESLYERLKLDCAEQLRDILGFKLHDGFKSTTQSTPTSTPAASNSTVVCSSLADCQQQQPRITSLSLPVFDYSAFPEHAETMYPEDDKVRCICGIFEDDGLMIQCDKCMYWQHSDCANERKEDDEYQCDFCLRGSCQLFSRDVVLSPQPEIRLPNCTYYRVLGSSVFYVRIGECVYVRKEMTAEQRQMMAELNRICVLTDNVTAPITQTPNGEQSPTTATSENTSRTTGGRKRAADGTLLNDLRIFRVERLFSGPNGHRFVFGSYFARPHETFCEPTRKFYRNELFVTPLYDTLPLSTVVGRCLVLDPATYCRGRPKVPSYGEQDVYICEYRVDKGQRLFDKMHVRNRYPLNTKQYVFETFPEKIKIKRDFMPFHLPTKHVKRLRTKAADKAVLAAAAGNERSAQPARVTVAGMETEADTEMETDTDTKASSTISFHKKKRQERLAEIVDSLKAHTPSRRS